MFRRNLKEVAMNYRPWFAPLETEDEDNAFGGREVESTVDFEAVNLRRAAVENAETLRLVRAI
jgi:hypothetical protein